ncbi:unnamed protein product [Didymodactylos carnosus]|uniref:Phytanoyl-CoA dioxygenase n=1 Tax=Didymodactylos carnosus TaxID=1234261 RepID=A0A814Z458_9BILA|nr:unnamed protein product [Didymodactylos carnosus]CAF1236774.1 unnamed protein product [Didymodactylos carnosus]CAF3561676.1 unnamed protein product [Didymodactylos carnosus]CAF3999113.1 unnamed protein product [Didymodactylos carnosus]
MSEGEYQLKVLIPSQLDQFLSEGYLVVENVISLSTIDDLFDEMNRQVLDKIAEDLVKQNLIDQTYSHLPLCDRIQLICRISKRTYPQYFDFSLPQSDIMNDTPLYLGDKLFNVMRNKNLIDVVSDILGTNEISSNPVQHMRMKLPQNITNTIAANFSGMVNAVPWHQDNGVILPEADNSNILTCWLALTDVTLNSGCMQVIPKSHRTNDGIIQHCPTREGLAISGHLIDSLASSDCQLLKPLPLPMTAGSVLLMNQRTVHSSLENTTENRVRISMDLRYQKTGTNSGRPLFETAGFVVRSELNQRLELCNSTIWAQNWLELREKLANERLQTKQFNRWDINALGCA